MAEVVVPAYTKSGDAATKAAKKTKAAAQAAETLLWSLQDAGHTDTTNALGKVTIQTTELTEHLRKGSEEYDRLTRTVTESGKEMVNGVVKNYKTVTKYVTDHGKTTAQTQKTYEEIAATVRDTVTSTFDSVVDGVRTSTQTVTETLTDETTQQKQIITKTCTDIVNGMLVTKEQVAVELLEAEGAEAVVPDLADFLQYCFYNQNFKVSHLGMKKSKALAGRLGVQAVEWFRSPATKAFAESKHFSPPAKIEHLAEMASDIVSLGNQTGEGWFLTGEMLELIENGAQNIICAQPFACLPNHVVGKGVIKELRRLHPQSNIVAIDFDPGASEVNQLNRIKLMLATAFKNMEKENQSM